MNKHPFLGSIGRDSRCVDPLNDLVQRLLVRELDRKVTQAGRVGGRPTVNRLDKFGLTGEKSIFVHCVHIDEAEMDVLAASRTAVVHNPESNMNNAVGVTPLLKLS